MREILKRVKRIEIKTRRMVNSTFAGEYHSAFKGQGLEFDEVRPYQFGDDIRSIDWNVTAKTGEPYIKIFKEEREQTMFVLFDISGSEDFGPENENKLQIGTEIAAVMSFSAMKNNDKIGLATFTDKIEKYFSPQKGKRHVLAIIRALLQHKSSDMQTSLRTALDFIRKTLKRRAVVIVISDFIDEGYEKSLIKLAQRNEVILVRLFNPKEMMMHGTGIMPFIDKESGRMFWMNSSIGGLRAEVARNFQKIESNLASLCKKNNIDLLSIQTDQDYFPELERFFKKRNSKRRKA